MFLAAAATNNALVVEPKVTSVSAAPVTVFATTKLGALNAVAVLMISVPDALEVSAERFTVLAVMVVLAIFC